MTVYLTSIFALFGLIIGSFLNVCIYRLPKKISVAKGRSYCPKCEKTLTPLMLIPVLSYIFLRGKCGHCAEKISPRYAAVEIITAILFAICGYIYGIMLLELAVIYAIFFAVLVVIAFIDIDTMEIPDRLHLIIAILAIPKMIIYPEEIVAMLIGAVAISVPMAVLAVVTGGFGGADIKLMAAAGLLIGTNGIVMSFLFAVIIMGSLGMILIIRKILFKREYTSKVAFCPALAIGIVGGTLFGEQIVNWYLELIFF